MMKLASVLLAGMLLAAQPHSASLPPDDAVRIREFYRLSSEIQDEIWSGWSQAEAPILLITADREYLFHDPVMPPGFERVGEGVYSRVRVFPASLLATFPAFGPPAVIAIGEPANTDRKRSTPWVITLMHEHFHQLQYLQPGYQLAVEALGLSHGDKSGMWMLNYDFPYSNPVVADEFSRLRDLLAQVLQAPDGTSLEKLATKYVEQREIFLKHLKSDDRKYLSFQLWQEGIARYTEIEAAEAAKGYRPSKEFAALADFDSFESGARRARADTLDELQRADLRTWKRTAFYSFGAAEGMLLDRIHPHWKEQYFRNILNLDALFSLPVSAR